MERYVDDSDELDDDELDGVGDVLAWLLQHGPFWDQLDQQRTITIQVAPDDDD